MKSTLAGLVRSPLLFGYTGCFLIVVGCIAFGSIVGFGSAIIALESAEGGARGAPFVFMGFALGTGAGVGFMLGIAWSVAWLRSRQAHTK